MSLYTAILACGLYIAILLGSETWSARSYMRARLPRAWRRTYSPKFNASKGV